MTDIRVHFEDGNTITTSINGTRAEIEAYYVGKAFQFGDTEECPRDKMVKAVSVDFLSPEPGESDTGKPTFEEVAAIHRRDLKFLATNRAQEMAKQIGMSSWMECISEFMTDADKAEVKALWATMPGHTCWNDAMLRWMAQT